jgi:hypothetical protein
MLGQQLLGSPRSKWKIVVAEIGYEEGIVWN